MYYHFVYKTTNITNNKFYIGKHSTKIIDDNYLGSGLIITEAIKKYGFKSFVRDILLFCGTEDEAYYYEEKLIEPWLGHPLCYNKVAGGKGFDRAAALKASDKAREKGYYGFASMSKEKHIEICSEGGKKGAEKCRTLNIGMFGWSFDDQSEWSKNSNSNRVWITDGKIDFRIKKSENIPEGFYVGRSIVGSKSRIGMNCWNNGEINVFGFESPGPEFEIGMKKETPTAKFPWWNNGANNKRAVTSPGPDFVLGRLKWKSKIVECPYCNKTGGETAMRQHHFERCKKKNG
jgi:hypothetical protein